jgi:hypothetical protein
MLLLLNNIYKSNTQLTNCEAVLDEFLNPPDEMVVDSVDDNEHVVSLHVATNDDIEDNKPEPLPLITHR